MGVCVSEEQDIDDGGCAVGVVTFFKGNRGTVTIGRKTALDVAFKRSLLYPSPPNSLHSGQFSSTVVLFSNIIIGLSCE